MYVQEAHSLDEWIRRRNMTTIVPVLVLTGVTSLLLFLSALAISSLLSVSISRQTREIGLRAALGANPRQLLAGILSRAMVLMGSGVIAGAALVLLFVAQGGGPTGRRAEDVALFAGWLAVTFAIVLAAGLLASIAPARRALRINPSDALKEA